MGTQIFFEPETGVVRAVQKGWIYEGDSWSSFAEFRTNVDINVRKWDVVTIKDGKLVQVQEGSPPSEPERTVAEKFDILAVRHGLTADELAAEIAKRTVRR